MLESFFNKVLTLLKKRLQYTCFYVNFEKFLRAFFYGTLPVAASVKPLCTPTFVKEENLSFSPYFFQPF